MKLGDIVQLHDDAIALDEASPADLELLSEHAFDPNKPSRARLEHWYIIRWCNLAPESFHTVWYQAIGMPTPGRLRITSPVTAVSPDHTVLQTENSTYELGTPGPTPMPDGVILAVRSAIISQNPEFAHEIGLDLPLAGDEQGRGALLH
jgi:hypothetical protein